MFRLPPSGANVCQPHPRRRMIAGPFLAAHVPIHPGRCKPRRSLPVEQADGRSSAPHRVATVPEIVPERIHGLLRVQRADGVGPSLLQQPPEAFPWRGLNQRVLVP